MPPAEAQLSAVNDGDGSHVELWATVLWYNCRARAALLSVLHLAPRGAARKAARTLRVIAIHKAKAVPAVTLLPPPGA